MHVLVGLLLAIFGASLATFGPSFSRRTGYSSSERFNTSNTAAFRLIGSALAVFGIMYTLGLLG